MSEETLSSPKQIYVDDECETVAVYTSTFFTTCAEPGIPIVEQSAGSYVYTPLLNTFRTNLCHQSELHFFVQTCLSIGCYICMSQQRVIQ